MTNKQRGIALILLGLITPPLALFATGLLVAPAPGMDGYMPAFFGGVVGAIIGLGMIIAGVTLLLG